VSASWAWRWRRRFTTLPGAGCRSFQRLLIDQPTMTGVLADMAVEYEAAVALTMRVARAFDAAEDLIAHLPKQVPSGWR
jgi:alkylation response protein AidB-like acyl-CoA dehydrogenase